MQISTRTADNHRGITGAADEAPSPTAKLLNQLDNIQAELRVSVNALESRLGIVLAPAHPVEKATEVPQLSSHLLQRLQDAIDTSAALRHHVESLTDRLTV